MTAPRSASDNRATAVEVHLPADLDPHATTVRLYTNTLSLVGEALAGVRFSVAADLSLSANAYDDKGRVVAASAAPFVTVAGQTSQCVLVAMPGIKEQSTKGPLSSVTLQAFGASERDFGSVMDGSAAEVWICYRDRSRQAALRRKLPFAFEEDFDILECKPGFRPPYLAAMGSLFPGPDDKKRLALFPLRHDGGNSPGFRVEWSLARTTGYALPSFVFDETLLDRAISAIRYHNASLLGPLLDEVAVNGAGKSENGPADLTLLLAATASIDDDSRWDQLHEVSAGLVERLPIPDAWILRAEILARLGWHKEAKANLRKIRYRQLPWTTAALKLLSQRLSYYDGKGMEETWTYRKRWYQNLLGMAHPSCVFCVLELPPRSNFKP